MTEHETAQPGIAEKLREAYETYRLFSFTPDPPERPLSERWSMTGQRVARVWLGMPLLPVILFRLRNLLLRRSVPLLPYFCEVLCTALWGVTIGRHVEVGAGFFMPHGQIVIDGYVRIGRSCVVNPWVTIGLSGSRRWGFDDRGPTIGDRVTIGTGAKVLGPITIGDGARIGANAVVIEDVPEDATVVGVPARVVRTEAPDWDAVREARALARRAEALRKEGSEEQR